MSCRLDGSDLQPFTALLSPFLGRCPRLVWIGPPALWKWSKSSIPIFKCERERQTLDPSFSNAMKRRRRRPYQPGATPQEQVQPQKEQGLKACFIIRGFTGPAGTSRIPERAFRVPARSASTGPCSGRSETPRRCPTSRWLRSSRSPWGRSRNCAASSPR
jgi:hypothetical protein